MEYATDLLLKHLADNLSADMMSQPTWAARTYWLFSNKERERIRYALFKIKVNTQQLDDDWMRRQPEQARIWISLASGMYSADFSLRNAIHRIVTRQVV